MCVSQIGCLRSLTAWSGGAADRKIFLRTKNSNLLYHAATVVYAAEAKVHKNKRISIDMLAVHDGQCGFLKVLVNPFFLFFFMYANE